MSVEFSVLYPYGVRTVGFASERDAQALADKYQGATVEWRTTWQPLAASSVSAGAEERATCECGHRLSAHDADGNCLAVLCCCPEFREGRASVSAGAGQVPADTIEKAMRALAETWLSHSHAEWVDRNVGAAYRRCAQDLHAALAAVRTPGEQT